MRGGVRAPFVDLSGDDVRYASLDLPGLGFNISSLVCAEVIDGSTSTVTYCTQYSNLWERRATFGLPVIHKLALRARRWGKTHIARNPTLGHELLST